MIDPRYSAAAQYWDGVTMLALIFTAIVTPFEARLAASAPARRAAPRRTTHVCSANA